MEAPTVAVGGIAEVVSLLDERAARVGDPGPWTETVYRLFLEAERRRFDDEGPGWPALAEATVARKGFDTVLYETGALEASLTDADGDGAVFVPVFADGTTSVTMGTDLKPSRPGRSEKWADWALAAFHQEGTSRMPARPVIDDVAKLVESAAAALAGWLSTGELAALL